MGPGIHSLTSERGPGSLTHNIIIDACFRDKCFLILKTFNWNSFLKKDTCLQNSSRLRTAYNQKDYSIPIEQVHSSKQQVSYMGIIKIDFKVSLSCQSGLLWRQTGPIIISMSYMLKDILTFLGFFLTIYISFVIVTYSVYRYAHCSPICNN